MPLTNPAWPIAATTISAENECANNGKLTSVELDFPTSPALATATAGTVTGWTAQVTKLTGSDSIQKVTWTNTGQVTGDGTFPLQIGDVPAGTKSIHFKALDTCDDGEVTRWVEPGENSEHPAPVLAIKAVKSQTTTTTAAESSSSDVVHWCLAPVHDLQLSVDRGPPRYVRSISSRRVRSSAPLPSSSITPRRST